MPDAVMAVEPDTYIEVPTRTALEYPSLPSQGPPVEIFCRPICSLLQAANKLGLHTIYYWNLPYWRRCQQNRRMRKKSVQQGRTERRGEPKGPVSYAYDTL